MSKDREDMNPGEEEKNDNPPPTPILFMAYSVGAASILWIIKMIIELLGCDCF